MPISIRLDPKTEKTMERIARSEGKTKSSLIRHLILDYIDRKSSVTTPWELGKYRFGKTGSGSGRLSLDRKKILREKLYAKKDRN